mgnify:CR=1 FL=1
MFIKLANVIALNVYQIGDQPVRQGSNLYVSVDFPAADIFARETDITVSGTQMNAFILLDGKQYYVTETTTEIETAANASSGGGSSYLVYTASIQQTGIAVPTDNKQVNTLGFGDWVRNDVGEYYNPSTTAMPATNKIYVSGVFLLDSSE